MAHRDDDGVDFRRRPHRAERPLASRRLRSAAAAAFLVSLCVGLAACGQSNGGSDGSGAAVESVLTGTLAWVTAECREENGALSGSSTLHIRQGEQAPSTVAFYSFAPIPNLGFLCGLIGNGRASTTPAAGYVQRFSVSPDGSVLVFELTNAFSILPLDPLPPEEEGIFVVRADGSGKRRLGPASREPCHLYVLDPSSPIAFRVWIGNYFSFSPDSRTVAYTDRGPGPDGVEATQIVTLDIASGTRTQVTRLPSAPPPPELRPVTLSPYWVDDETINFASFANIDGSNPDGVLALYTNKRDGSGLQRREGPAAQPGSVFAPEFQITGGSSTGVEGVREPGIAEDDIGDHIIREVFLHDGDDLIQLTNFHRSDTFGTGASAAADAGSNDGRRILILASVDPFGTNPTHNCQLFSISRTGTDLRQITSFSDGAHSPYGCNGDVATVPPGCGLAVLGQDPTTETLLLGSSCHPVHGANPFGYQFFAMRPDGAKLRQLTNFRGYVIEPGGAITYEFPSAFSYGPYR